MQHTLRISVSRGPQSGGVVAMSTLKPDEIVAYVNQYLEKKGVDTSGLTPEAMTAFVLAYQEIEGGALTTALTPDDVTAMVVKYLEKEMATHFNILTWRIPWTEEPGGLQSMGSQDLAT